MVNLIIISNEILERIDFESFKPVIVKAQILEHLSCGNFIQAMRKDVAKRFIQNGLNIDEGKMRLLNTELEYDALILKIIDQLQNNESRKYKININGKILSSSKSMQKLKGLTILEIGNHKESWCIQPNNSANVSSDEEEKYQQPVYHHIESKSTTPKNGICGLYNIGNTCFMNSGIQSLQNTSLLSDYFLSQKQVAEYNPQNPLGSNDCLLTRKFVDIIDNLYTKTEEAFTPKSFKLQLAKFYNLFTGYDQHDCQEFLTVCLDGLHEDLNRVIIKEVQKQPKLKSHVPDEKQSAEYWKLFLKRNKSIIVDIFYGQYKSEIICPCCNNSSKSFSPFSICSLPIPVLGAKDQKVYLYFQGKNIQSDQIYLELPFSNEIAQMQALQYQLGTMLKVHPGEIDFAFSGYSYFEDVSVFQPTLQIAKKSAKRRLILYELSTEESLIPMGKRIGIKFCLTLLNQLGDRKFFTNMAQFYFRETSTPIDIQFFLFKRLRFLLGTDFPQDIKGLSDEELYERLFDDSPLTKLKKELEQEKQEKIRLKQEEYDNEMLRLAEMKKEVNDQKRVLISERKKKEVEQLEESKEKKKDQEINKVDNQDQKSDDKKSDKKEEEKQDIKEGTKDQKKIRKCKKG